MPSGSSAENLFAGLSTVTHTPTICPRGWYSTQSCIEPFLDIFPTSAADIRPGYPPAGRRGQSVGSCIVTGMWQQQRLRCADHVQVQPQPHSPDTGSRGCPVRIISLTMGVSSELPRRALAGAVLLRDAWSESEKAEILERT